MRNIDFPILSVFYNLILLASLLSIARCIITTFIKPTSHIGVLVNKIVWLIVRFGQLSTELSVVLFGLFFGKLGTGRVILRIMFLTIPISLLYITIQAFLELVYPDQHYIIYVDDDHYYDLYGHGGMIFWFISSIIFFLIYTTIFLLPFTRLKTTFPIPTKKSFYVYCFLMAILCFLQLVGAALTYATFDSGLCLLDFTSLVNFTLFGPLVYIVFLRKFFQKEVSFLNRYPIDDDLSYNHSLGSTDPLNRSVNSSYNTGNVLISANKYRKKSSLFSNYEQPNTSSAGVNISYSSFRDKQMFNNPFDFNESDYEEDGGQVTEDEPKVIILQGSNY